MLGIVIEVKVGLDQATLDILATWLKFPELTARVKQATETVKRIAPTTPEENADG